MLPTAITRCRDGEVVLCDVFSLFFCQQPKAESTKEAEAAEGIIYIMTLLQCAVCGACTLYDTDAADSQAAEMEELMQNKDFLQSVLRDLPGVNPEQALLNLQEMTEAVTSTSTSTKAQEGEGEGEGEEKMDEGKEKKVSCGCSLVYHCSLQPLSHCGGYRDMLVAYNYSRTVNCRMDWRTFIPIAG